MPIVYRELNDTEYYDQLFQVIWRAEGYRPQPYRDSVGIPTIGVGFRIDEHIDDILRDFGFDMRENAPAAERGYIQRIRDVVTRYGAQVTPQQMNQYINDLDAIMAERSRANGGATRDHFRYDSVDEARGTYDRICPDYEDRLRGWLGETNETIFGVVPRGWERIALMSLTYNGYMNYNRTTGDPIRSPSLNRALLVDENRAEAWYEIRYNTPSSRDRIAQVTPTGNWLNKIKRNFFEAELFGLYDDPEHVDLDNAEQAYRMLQNHRDDIARQEALFSIGFDGTRGTWTYQERTPLEAANADYDPGLFFEDGRIDTIATSLDPAKTALFDYLQDQYSGNSELLAKLQPGYFSSVDIYISIPPERTIPIAPR